MNRNISFQPNRKHRESEEQQKPGFKPGMRAVQTGRTKGTCDGRSRLHGGLGRRRDKTKLCWEVKKAICGTHLGATREPRWYSRAGLGIGASLLQMLQIPKVWRLHKWGATVSLLWRQGHKGTVTGDLMGTRIRSWIWKAPGQYQQHDSF